MGGALGPHDCLETPGAPCEPLLPGRPFCLPLPFPLSRIRSHICPWLSAPRRARLHLICGTDVSLVLCRLLTFWGSFCSSARLCLFRRTNPVHTQADHAPARGNVLCPRDLVKPHHSSLPTPPSRATGKAGSHPWPPYVTPAGPCCGLTRVRRHVEGLAHTPARVALLEAGPGQVCSGSEERVLEWAGPPSRTGGTGKKATR